MAWRAPAYGARSTLTPPHHPLSGALSGILSYYSVTYGSAVQPLLCILAGILSLMVWLFKVDKYLVFIPGAVMHGFTLGVAFIISANQLNFLLGLPKLKRHPEFMMNIAETFTNMGASSPFAIAFFALSFFALFNLVRKYGKIPWAVLLALVGIIIGAIADGLNLNLPIQTIRTRYGDLSVQVRPAAERDPSGCTAASNAPSPAAH